MTFGMGVTVTFVTSVGGGSTGDLARLNGGEGVSSECLLIR